ncbi:MAG: NfeD family protein [Leptolyngbyaceae cyanobacterium bins.349]|nr:NfeD family protein [Leptolyngbyaceae cyanobacterium bins.349]
MMTVYWVCFAVGGTFVFLAVLSGVDGVDFGDNDFEVPLDEDVEITEPKERSPSPFARSRDPWYSFFSILKSLKFWTFAICFFGLTGLVLSHLAIQLSPSLIAMIAVSMGILCGSLVAGSLRTLQRRQVDSLVRSPDLVGLTGTVEVPFDQTRRGKVRLLVKGTMLDMIASTDAVKVLQPGDRVLVVGTEQNRLWVVPEQESMGNGE